MARTILIAGTASHVGKSTVAAGLCRYLANQGRSVAPFKAQNMSNNARVAVGPSGEWGEIGVSQYAQAKAARVPAQTDMNPVLLKPRGDGESQVIINGEPVGNYAAQDYYEAAWVQAKAAAESAHQRLGDAFEVIIAEGAGSIAEVNLHDRDLANVETARFADAEILLVTDIERGGAFASLIGTWSLLPEDLQRQVIGIAITKFRGDRDLLQAGIETVESRTGVPVVGVLPFDPPGLPQEDSVSLPSGTRSATWGTDDGVDPRDAVTIGVPHLSRISNFTDLEPLAAEPGVRVQFIPPTGSLDGVDAVVLPGTKNTVDDLAELHESGLAAAIGQFDGPIIGLCGGYQMLGQRITNAAIEGTGDRDVIDGIGLLPVETEFAEQKHVTRTTRQLTGHGPVANAAGEVSGYEIHMGTTRLLEDVDRPFNGDGAVKGDVLGTYLHGLFENPTARTAFIEYVYQTTDRERPRSGGEARSGYEQAARLVREHLQLDALDLPTPDPPTQQ